MNECVPSTNSEEENVNQDAKVETMTYMKEIQIEILNVQSEGFVGTIIVGTDRFKEGERVTVIFQENVTVIDEDGNHFENMSEEPNADSSGYEVGASVWIGFQAYEYQTGSEYNRVYAYHVEPGKNSSITSDTELMEEYSFEELLNDEQFRRFLPIGIIKGYELQEQVQIYNGKVLKARFYNSGLDDELSIKIAEKEWFYEQNENITLNTVIYQEKNGRIKQEVTGMKKWILLAFALIIVVILAISIKKPSGDPPDSNGQDYFNAKVLKVYEKYVEVECLELTTGAITTGTTLSVPKEVHSKNEIPDMQVDDEKRVVFTGVLETYPPQLQTVWAIYLLDKDGNVTTVKKDISFQKLMSENWKKYRYFEKQGLAYLKFHF